MAINRYNHLLLFHLPVGKIKHASVAEKEFLSMFSEVDQNQDLKIEKWELVRYMTKQGAFLDTHGGQAPPPSSQGGDASALEDARKEVEMIGQELIKAGEMIRQLDILF